MITERPIDKIRTRPRFKIVTNMSVEDYTALLKRQLYGQKEQFSGNINQAHADIYVKEGAGEYWSPRLSLRAEEEDGKTVIRGLFGPSSTVWTFFMFLYFVFGILWMVFITLWFVGRQIKSVDYGWGLWASFVALFFILLTYLAARYGQKKAKPEMDQLRGFAFDTVQKLPD